MWLLSVSVGGNTWILAFKTQILYLNISSCTSPYVSSHVLSSPAAISKLPVRRSCPRRPIEITAAHLSGKCVSPGLILRPRWRPIAPFSAQSRPRTRIANATPCSSDAPSSLCSGDTSLSLSSRCSNVDSQAEHHQPTMAPFKNRRGCVTVNRETLSLFFFFF